MKNELTLTSMDDVWMYVWDDIDIQYYSPIVSIEVLLMWMNTTEIIELLWVVRLFDASLLFQLRERRWRSYVVSAYIVF